MNHHCCFCVFEKTKWTMSYFTEVWSFIHTWCWGRVSISVHLCVPRFHGGCSDPETPTWRGHQFWLDEGLWLTAGSLTSLLLSHFKVYNHFTVKVSIQYVASLHLNEHQRTKKFFFFHPSSRRGRVVVQVVESCLSRAPHAQNHKNKTRRIPTLMYKHKQR